MTNSCTPESAETIRQLYTPGSYYSNLYAEGVYNAACDAPSTGGISYTETYTYECYLIHSTTTSICPEVWVSSRNEMIDGSITINSSWGIGGYTLRYAVYTSRIFEVLSDVNDPESNCYVPYDQSGNDWYITINTDSCPPYDNMTEAEIEAHIIACCP